MMKEGAWIDSGKINDLKSVKYETRSEMRKDDLK